MYVAWFFHLFNTKMSLLLKDIAVKIMHKIHVAGVSVLTLDIALHFSYFCVNLEIAN